jgi:kynurenine formamidase
MVVGMSVELGMLRHIDETKRREALALVREGRLFDLGHVLDEHVPVFPGRYFRQTLVTTAHHANGNGGVGEGHVNWITEQVTGTMQLGTHLDALSHLQRGDVGYNGWTIGELAGTAGVKRLGVETVPQIVTRGWLVDASEAGHVVGLDHVRDIDPAPGDAVLFHTGWGAHWNDPDRPFEVPLTLNVEHGVFIVENLDTSELAAAGVREFCLILTHPKLRGATGAWTSPIALV